MKTWTKEGIIELLKTNDKAVYRALMVIYGNQTSEEQSMQLTLVHNKKGFMACDAQILTSFAEAYRRYGFLSEKQLAHLRKRIVHYHRQLLDAVKVKEAA